MPAREITIQTDAGETIAAPMPAPAKRSAKTAQRAPRPRGDERFEEVVKVKVTTGERDAWRRIAAERGQSVSSFVRAVVTDTLLDLAKAAKRREWREARAVARVVADRDASAARMSASKRGAR